MAEDSQPGGAPVTRGKEDSPRGLSQALLSAGDAIFVWSTLGVLLLLALRLASGHSLPIPFWDEWEWVPEISGRRPLTLEWLWSPHGGQGIFLPKLYYYVLMAKVFSLGAAPFNMVSALILGGMAALGVLAVRAVRGRTLWSDSLLPVLFLHGNHWATITSPLGTIILLPSLLLCIFLCLLISGRSGPGRSVALGICLVGLSLCGRAGLPAVILLSPWLVGLEVLRWRRSGREPRIRDGLAPGLGLLALILSVLHLPGPGTAGGAAPTLEAVFGETTRCLTLAFGHGASALWPWSGIALGALGGICGAALLWRAVKAPEDRARAAGLILVLSALFGLALLIGVESARRGDDGGSAFPYTSILCLIPLAAYGALEIGAWPAVTRPLRVLLPLLAWILLWPNTQEGLQMAETRRTQGQAFVEDLRSGRTLLDLGRRHARRWHPSTDQFVLGLKMMRDARLGIFREVAPPDLMRHKPDLWAVEMRRKGTPNSGEIITVKEGVPAILAHAPSIAARPLPDGTRLVRFGFGIVEAAHTGERRSDGVEFRVDLEGTDGKTETLWSRRLDPLNDAAHRGLQTGEVEIPHRPPGTATLLFITLPGPADHSLWDWSYWGDVEFITP